MSSPEARAEGERWLRYSTEDLATAELLLRGADAPPRQACFLAQQAAEKALKAVLVSLGRDFPRTHDVEALRNLLPAEWRAVQQLPALGRLAVWAVGARYVGDWPEPSSQDASEAVDLGRRVLEAVREGFRAGSGNGERQSTQ